MFLSIHDTGRSGFCESSGCSQKHWSDAVVRKATLLKIKVWLVRIVPLSITVVRKGRELAGILQDVGNSCCLRCSERSGEVDFFNILAFRRGFIRRPFGIRNRTSQDAIQGE